ncbi:hypothetical protein SGGMMB4_05021 [Sodalis glossinidius str. 'morsitans']|uniref:Uncharacterized protein n=1 Tax=Sodalis glossinidius (strain morsitans) TaxID=343509 RepID=A0A193QMT1_SODGM|nr:hypothetical protein SGGMMB4_05021 [Sodalis glossinidius str. 'morsitans']
MSQDKPARYRRIIYRYVHCRPGKCLAGPEETAEGIDEKSAIVLVLPVLRPRARRLGI